ncbi:MAG: hypothetical protein IPF68_05330 [Bacteroidales bacterium]|nr:hypothetical protein [Bacteroidales bacterium]
MNASVNSLLKKYAALELAETYKPCNTQILEESYGLLVKSGHAWSDELSSFYLHSNGFFYNGIYIFSVRSDETDEYYDILVRNVEWNISERLPGCVAFGRSDEEIYVFNQNENKYQILDFTGWDEYYAFDSMAELFEFVVSERI